MRIVSVMLISLGINSSLAFAEFKRSDAFGQNIIDSNIKESEVQAAQEAWGKALIKISEDFDAKGSKAATATATRLWSVVTTEQQQRQSIKG